MKCFRFTVFCRVRQKVGYRLHQHDGIVYADDTDHAQRVIASHFVDIEDVTVDISPQNPYRAISLADRRASWKDLDGC
jgi:hypothetical protein